MTLGEIVVFEKNRSEISWTDIAASLRVNPVVLNSIKSAIIYANENKPDIFIISDNGKLAWNQIINLIKSHLNIKTVVICSERSIPGIPWPILSKNCLLAKLEEFVYDSFLAICIKERQGLPVGNSVLLGTSPQMIRLFKTILKRASGKTNLLICGETGVGKNMVAEACHYYNPERSPFPLHIIDVGAIHNLNFEASMFGLDRGMITGKCDRDHVGYFEETQGSLVFDHITNLSENKQHVFFDAIEKRFFNSVGSSKLKAVTARLLFVTNVKLDEIGRKPVLDLLAGTGALSINISPLRDRKEDIPLLATTYIRQLNAEYMRSKYISDEALQYLMDYSWPENVWGLQGVLISTFLDCGNVITRDDVENELLSRYWI